MCCICWYLPGGIPPPPNAALSETAFTLPFSRDVFGLRVLEKSLVGALAAKARLLDPAERRGRVRHQPPVEADHPSFQRLRHPQPAPQVLGVDVGDEPDLARVGPANGVRLVAEPDYPRDPPG